MRKLFLAHFSFTTNIVEHQFYQIVVVDSKEVPHSTDPLNTNEEKTATVKAERWFKANYPESKLGSVTVFNAITGYGENMELEPIMIDNSNLVSFGHYLLSEERTNRITETFNTYPTSGTLKERLREVYHADVENWKYNMKTDKKDSPVGIESSFVRSFGPDVFPPFDDGEDSASIDVIIDPDGERKEFYMGYYSFVDKCWKYETDAGNVEDYGKNLRWFMPPYANS